MANRLLNQLPNGIVQSAAPTASGEVIRIDANNLTLPNVADPALDTDAANRQWVELKLGAIDGANSKVLEQDAIIFDIVSDVSSDILRFVWFVSEGNRTRFQRPTLDVQNVDVKFSFDMVAAGKSFSIPDDSTLGSEVSLTLIPNDIAYFSPDGIANTDYNFSKIGDRLTVFMSIKFEGSPNIYTLKFETLYQGNGKATFIYTLYTNIDT